MSTVIFSQANAAGVALLAAYIRLWTETRQVEDLHVVCDPTWTLTEPFWFRTVPWLLGHAEGAPPIHRVVYDGGTYRLAASTLPSPATIVLLRQPRNSRDPEGCVRLLTDLVTHFGPLGVIEILDETLPPHRCVEGLRSCRLSSPPLLSLQGPPPHDVLRLAGVSAAALYARQTSAFPYMRAAHSLVVKVRADLPGVLLEMLNHGITALDDGFPIREAPREYIEEGDAILFPVRLSEGERALLKDETETYLEHILQSVLANHSHVSWGIAYIPLEGDPDSDFKTVVAARYDPRAMGRTLADRFRDHPSARDWHFDIKPRDHYAVARTTARELRRMMTAVLPAFFPALDAALRRQGLVPSDRAHVVDALAALEPSVAPIERAGSGLALQGPKPWTIGGTLSPTHPAALAAACLLGPTAKEDSIRELHEQRRGLQLCRPWHNLKNEPAHREDVVEWRASRTAEIERFRGSFRTLWDRLRMPLPPHQFAYAEQAQDWDDLATLARACETGEAGDDFFNAVKRQYEGHDRRRGLGDEFFFSLTELLSWFHTTTPHHAKWTRGGFWDPPEAADRDCVMWWPEVVENILRPLWDNVPKHAGQSGFVRITTRDAGDWLELSFATSGQGVPSDLLRERLHERTGLATAVRTVESYGGHVMIRCRDGWFRAGSPFHELTGCEPTRPKTIRVALVDVPALERSVAGNPALTQVEPQEHPDVVFAATLPSANPGWQAPCVIVGEREVPGALSMTTAQAADFLETLVGFEIVCRFRRLGPVAQARPPARSSAPRGGGACLLVNDEAPQLARWADEVSGFRLLTATNAEEAWARWQAEGRDIGLVITDNYMPEENQGVGLAERLRESGYRGPIVIATRAPSVVPDELREALCLSVTGSSAPLREDRVRAWMAHVPS